MWIVRWNGDSTTKSLNLLSNAIELAVQLNQANPGWRPSVETSDQSPLTADELRQVRAGGL